MIATLVLALSLAGQAEHAVAAGQLCASPEGVVFSCSQPTVGLCWDTRHRVFASCNEVAQEASNVWRYAFHATVANGLDLYSTDYALRHNERAKEGNKFIPTVESRVGAKMVMIGFHIGSATLIERAGRPRLALWYSRGLAAVVTGVAIRNFYLARQ